MEENSERSNGSVLLGIAAGLLGLFWMVILVPHVYRIFRPSIVIYPWDEGNNSDSNKIEETTTSTTHRTVVFAASYNPPHHGHIRMLEYISKKYERVIAVVGFNPNKKYLVSPEERADLLREMLKLSRTKSNVTVEVVDGYIWRYAKRVGATLFFRGIRDWEKDGRDEGLLQILNTWGPLLYGPLAIPIPTIYIEGDPRYNHVSSTLIRSICNGGGTSDEQTKNTETSLSELVPSEVAGRVAKLYGSKR